MRKVDWIFRRSHNCKTVNIRGTENDWCQQNLCLWNYIPQYSYISQRDAVSTCFHVSCEFFSNSKTSTSAFASPKTTSLTVSRGGKFTSSIVRWSWRSDATIRQTGYLRSCFNPTRYISSVLERRTPIGVLTTYVRRLRHWDLGRLLFRCHDIQCILISNTVRHSV